MSALYINIYNHFEQVLAHQSGQLTEELHAIWLDKYEREIKESVLSVNRVQFVRSYRLGESSSVANCRRHTHTLAVTPHDALKQWKSVLIG